MTKTKTKTKIWTIVALTITFVIGILGGVWLSSDKPQTSSATMQDAEEAYAHEDYVRTFEILLPLAKAGEPLAEYRIGMMLNSGVGVEQNVDKAIPWLRLAVKSNVAGARDALGNIYVERAQHAELIANEISNYQHAADLGATEAHAVLGSYFLIGQGVPKDYDKALSLLELAAGQQDARALTNLGFMYATGAGVTHNDTRAFEYYLQAAELGLVRAQLAVGMFLETGRGVGMNLAEATRWFLNAASAGDESAAARLGSLIANDHVSPPGNVAAANLVKAAAIKGEIAALDWLKRKSETGDSFALGRLSEIYLDSNGVNIDLPKGLALLQRGAEAGDGLSQLELSRRYGSGNDFEQDYVAAHQWANLAASSGNTEAIELRGIYANLMTPEQIEAAQARAREWTAARTEATEGAQN